MKKKTKKIHYFLQISKKVNNFGILGTKKYYLCKRK